MATTTETEKVKTLVSLHASTNELLDLIKRNVGLGKSAIIEKAVVEFVKREIDSLVRLGLDADKAEQLVQVSSRRMIVVPDIHA